MKTNMAGMSVLLLLLSCSFSLVSAAKGDLVGPNGLVAAYKPYIVFPRNNHVYSADSLMLNVSFKAMAYANMNYSATYSLDGQAQEYFPVVKHYLGNWVIYHGENDYVDGSVKLPALSDGSHSLTLFLTLDWELGYQNGTTVYTYYDSEIVNFTVGQNQTPQSEYNQLEASYQSLLSEYNSLNADYNGLKENYTDLQEQARGLEETNSDLQSNLNSQKIVILVMMSVVVLSVVTIVIASLLVCFRKHRKKTKVGE